MNYEETYAAASRLDLSPIAHDALIAAATTSPKKHAKFRREGLLKVGYEQCETRYKVLVWDISGQRFRLTPEARIYLAFTVRAQSRRLTAILDAVVKAAS